MLEGSQAFSGFSVKDKESTMTFYGEYLGLDITDGLMGMNLHLPNGGHIFIYPKPDHQPATFTILNFPVDNIDGAVKELKDKGIIFESYDGLTDENNIARGLSRNQGPDIAWFKDPSGNIISVLQDS